MHNPFDLLAKRIGKAALDASGPTFVQREISRDAQYADLLHDPDPDRAADRARLGLLGRMASVVCILEPHGHALDADELRACLSKHLAFWQERTREARARNLKRRHERRPAEPLVPPFLWILTTTVSKPMLRGLELRSAPSWPPGVYFLGGNFLRVGLISASELPRDQSTLLVRILVAGPHLSETVAELYELPEGAHERMVAEPVVVSLERAIGLKPSRTPEEEDFIVSMESVWEKKKRMNLDEGRSLGRTEEAARAVLTALRVRGIAVGDGARERILAEKDLGRLERWLERAILAASFADVIDVPS